jgi:hypothetical protein
LSPPDTVLLFQLDALAGFRDIAVAVAIAVEAVSILYEPDARLFFDW